MSEEPPVVMPGSPEDRLAQSFTFVETKDPGFHRVIAADRHLADLDYRSRLTILPDQEQLRRIAGVAGDVLPRLGAAEERRLDLLQGVAQRAQEALRLATELDAKVAELDEARALGKSWTHEDEAALRALLERSARARAEALAHLRTTLWATAPERADAQTDAAADEPDSARIQERIARELRELEATLRRDRARLEAETASLRLRAVLHAFGKSVPIHIENYDTLDTHWAAKEPRIGLGSREDQERLRREVAALDAMLTLRAEAATAALEPDDDLERMAEVVRGDRRRWQDLGGELRTRAGGEGLAALVAAATEGATAEQQEQLARLDTLLRELEQLETALRSTNGAPAEALAQATRAVETLRALELDAALDVLAQRLRARAADLTAAPGVEPAVAADATLVAAREALEQHRRDLDRVELLAGAAGLRAVAFGPAAAAATIDPRVRPRGLDEIVPGEIDLNDTIADRGHRLEVIAEILHPAGAAEEIYPSVRRTFAVDRLGLVNSVSADVAFVRQTSEEHFRPAPAAAWTLRWRPPDEPDDSWGTNLWQVLDPGVGISVTAFSTDDLSFQAGVGPHVSFFNDLIRAGWGYNLSADSNRGYVFLGIGVFQAVEGLGSLVTGGFNAGSSPGSK